MKQARAVTVIPATMDLRTHAQDAPIVRRRAAGYARVSTDSDEQFTSYEAQVEYYRQYIQNHSDWEFVRVYADEGISGLNTKKRDGFNEMIADALSGKIDIIVTKSVSRFARNTVDSLVTIRKLKEKGVEVFFEKENIYTFDGKGELLLTIMSSLAQEESRSISENVTWGQHRRFEEGRVSFAYSNFLGYDRNSEKGKCLPPVINPEQAEIVKRIYRMFMQGKTAGAIAKTLTEEGVPTPAKKRLWYSSTVESILTNEKYKGSALMQKYYTVDFLTKKTCRNEGQVQQYFVEDSHEAIIPPEEWEKVQTEFARRKSLGRKYSGDSIFGSKIICGDCGTFFGAKTWNSTSKYRRTIYRCNGKYKGDRHCKTPHLTEEQIKSHFVQAINILLENRTELIQNCEQVKELTTSCEAVDRELAGLHDELRMLADLARRCISQNAETALNQSEYTDRYNAYTSRYEEVSARVDNLENQKLARQMRAIGFETFLRTMRSIEDGVQAFDEALWSDLVEVVTVHNNGTMVFRFKNGQEIIG